ncbi:MAG: DUF4124 domain-containing protein [Burkholderiales bacterium]|nr:DUF4124 domain-containing protein [Burkholderiales bacterium]
MSLIAALASMFSLPALGDTYKCVDANGRATYTNINEEIRGKNCTFVKGDNVSVVPAIKPVQSAKPGPSPPGFPKVDPATQKNRDDGRRRILEGELSSEEKALIEAKAELTRQQSIRNGDERNYQRVLDRLQKYKDDVERHDKNVAALKRELENIK